MNRFVFDDQVELLIPKAVAYSAGLLVYFFRRRLDFIRDPSRVNGFKIVNRSPEDMSGTFELFYDGTERRSGSDGITGA